MTDEARRLVIAAVERVIGADPTKVWALVADPDLIGEWAGVETVGYMGTELPKPGQSVFVRRSRIRVGAKTRRVEITDWDAGTTVTCLVETDRSAIRFEIGIRPEVMRDQIMTRVRLTQRVETSSGVAPLVGWLLRRSLNKKLGRIEKAVAG